MMAFNIDRLACIVAVPAAGVKILAVEAALDCQAGDRGNSKNRDDHGSIALCQVVIWRTLCLTAAARTRSCRFSLKLA
jgi:hypothetical protein